MRGYLAGPMRNYPQFNFPAFFDYAAQLRKEGHCVISPAEHDVEIGLDWQNEDEEGFSLISAMIWDLTQVAYSECIWLMPGWEESRGAAIEHALAEMLGKKVIFL